ncbi:MAG: hypothetical protein QMD44_01445 [Thermodesulfovibrionales bacterium]|jgi:hypothetical protein|nr:hypothetical protein [Thermodesulfovibrionales bacterium]
MPCVRKQMIRGLIVIILSFAVLLSAYKSSASSGAALLKFSELYESISVMGMKISKKTLSLVGKRVTMRGFMAPPLKPDLKFFVLTRQPVDICPFCDSDADWPEDIVVVYLKGKVKYSADGTPVTVEGVLDVGSSIDKETGFVSRIRIIDARASRL